jgi:XTP/dITP diphosphohydrolase
MVIWFASGNAHKRAELAAILADALPGRDLLLKIPPDGGFSFNPAETGDSFFENAFLKARVLRRLLDAAGEDAPVIADDSGLCVDALSGRPGIHSARYGSEAGRNLSAPERNALLLAECAAAAARGNVSRRARFVSAMVLLFPGERFFAAQETLEGELVRAERGTGGFGYDPLLYLPERGKTVAELPVEEKNALSHRGKAARALVKLLEAGGYA